MNNKMGKAQWRKVKNKRKYAQKKQSNVLAQQIMAWRTALMYQRVATAKFGR